MCQICSTNTSSSVPLVFMTIGGAVAITGIFLSLASHQLLPSGVNVISQLPHGWQLGFYGLGAIGATALLGGVIKSRLRKDKKISQTSDEIPKAFSDDPLEIEMARVKKFDTLSESNSWKRGPGKQEKKQTLDHFRTSESCIENLPRKTLQICSLGPIKSEMFPILGDYLKAVHGMQVEFSHGKLDSTSKRGNQYAVEPQLANYQNTSNTTTYTLCLTCEDVYPAGHNSMHFIHGVGDVRTASGVLSTYRLGKGDICLKRLLQIGSHEFGHMRGIAHCVDNCCNMQGSNGGDEADRVPLTYCVEDMAKICYANEWSLQEGYQRQLDFFTAFSSSYPQYRIDFSKEIAYLRKMVEELSQPT